MNIDEIFIRLNLPIEQQVIDSINSFIDEKGYRNSTEQIFENKPFYQSLYGKEWIEKHNTRKFGGIGKNSLSIYKIPQELYNKSNLQVIIDILADRYKLVQPFISKMPAKYMLNWHTDAARKSGINIPLNVYNESTTMFAASPTSREECLENIEINDVDYELGYAHLLNVTKYHSVVNNSANPRFIIVIVWDSGNDQFNDVKDYLKLRNIL